VACFGGLLKDFRGVFESLPHAPGERNSDQCPSEEHLGIETAPADPIGALRPNSQATRRRDFFPFLLHVPLGVNRPDQRIANESGTRRQART
jgi:hypothetical protein